MLPKKVLSRDQALLRMADLCARSEQCPYDIRRKLLLKGMAAADVESVIAELSDRDSSIRRAMPGVSLAIR